MNDEGIDINDPDTIITLDYICQCLMKYEKYIRILEKETKDIKYKNEMIDRLKEDNQELLNKLYKKEINDNYISKDKIRKLKEYYEDSFKYAENEIESNNIYVSIKNLEKILEE